MMKKRIQKGAAILTAALLLAGCQPKEEIPEPIDEETSPQAYQWVMPETDAWQGDLSTVVYQSAPLYANFASVLTEEDRAAYEGLIGAIIAHNVGYTVTREIFDRISCLAVYSPYYYLVDAIAYDADIGGVTLTYRNDGVTHAQLVEQFEQKMRELLARSGVFEIGEDASGERRALCLYRFVASQCSYQYGENQSLFLCVLNDSYTDTAFNVLFAQLLLQAGIPAVLAVDESGHFWTAAELDGSWFHFDPAYEFMGNAGYGLMYFGMDDTRRNAEDQSTPYHAVIPDFWLAYEPTPETDADSDTGETAESGENDTAADTAATAQTTLPDDESTTADGVESGTAGIETAEPHPVYTFTLLCEDARYANFASCSNWVYAEDGNSLILFSSLESLENYTLR